jgi:hypothetical protein
VVAEELTRPFDTARAPMVRVVLLRAGHTTPAAIVLTCAHTIVDGLSAGYILRDLFSALNGHPLQALPIPPSQEELIGRLRDAQAPAVLAAPVNRHRRSRRGLTPRPGFGPSTAQCPTSAPSPSTRT